MRPEEGNLALGLMGRSERVLELGEAFVRRFPGTLFERIPPVARQGERLVATMILEKSCQETLRAERPDGSFAVIEGDAMMSGGGATSEQNLAEVLLGACLREDFSIFATLDTYAAITVWNAEEKTLRVVRDRHGVRQVYYARDRTDALLWSSDFETLLRISGERRIDRDALDFFLAAGFFPAPWTPVRGLRKVPPGHVLRARRGGEPGMEPYWRPTGRPKLHLGRMERVDRLQETFECALRRRSRPEKTGLLLSSGIDSTLVLAGLCALVGAKPAAFTFRYGDYEGTFNEGEEASRRARHFGVEHHLIEMAPRDIADGLDKMLISFGLPFTYGLHSYRMGSVAKKGVGVLVTGHGADGLYAGRGDLLAHRILASPPPVRTIVGSLDTLLGRVSARASQRLTNLRWVLDTALVGGLNEPITRKALREKLYLDASFARGHGRLVSELSGLALIDSKETVRDRICMLNARFFDAECVLQWCQRWSRLHGLALHLPYMDNELQELVLRFPRSGRRKGDFLALAERLMPSWMTRTPKIPQTVPIAWWFRGPLEECLRSELASTRLREQGLFDPRAVNRLVDDHVQGRGNHEWTLWAVLAITVWKEKVLEGVAPVKT